MDTETLARKSARNYQDNICSVCHGPFSMTNRSVICSKCFQKTCRLHIYTEKTQTICEICVRAEIKRNLLHEKQEMITGLKSEFRSLQHREKANVKEISIKAELIGNLENSLQGQKEAAFQKISKIADLVEEEVESIQVSAKTVQEMNSEIEKCKKNSKEKHEAWVAATTELIKVQNSLTAVQKEHDSLKRRHNNLLKENEKMLTFQKIRTMTCNKCYKQIVLQYKEDIIKILSRKEKKSRLIPSILAINLIDSDEIHSSSCKCLVV
jgi:myosin heavy subunit